MATKTKKQKTNSRAVEPKTDEISNKADQVSLKTLQNNPNKVYGIDPNRLHDGELNERTIFAETEEEWEAWKAGLLENLQGIDPLLITWKNEKLTIIRGHRRIKAIRELIDEGHEIVGIPCRYQNPKSLTTEAILLDQLTSNNAKDYEPVEQARVVRKLIDAGMTTTEVSKRTGKSQAHISNLSQLTNLPRKVQNWIEEGKISYALVLDLVRNIGDDEAAIVEEIGSAIEYAKDEGKEKATKSHFIRSYQENGYDDEPSPDDQKAESEVNGESSDKNDQVESYGNRGTASKKAAKKGSKTPAKKQSGAGGLLKKSDVLEHLNAFMTAHECEDSDYREELLENAYSKALDLFNTYSISR